MTRFVNAKAVRALAREHKRKAGRVFLTLLNDFVKRKVIDACRQHNGGRIVLDRVVAEFVGIRHGKEGSEKPG